MSDPRPPRERSGILRTDGLTKRFDDLTAVDDVSLAIAEGEFRSLIGPNGAGKTTLFHLLSGALTPTSGAITFRGAGITSESPAERVARGLARSFQLTTVFDGLSVRENVRLAVQSGVYDELSRRQRFLADPESIEPITTRTSEVVDQIELGGLVDTRASDLSYGDRRRLEIGLVLATDPIVVLLDEPTAGMSGEETARTIELIEDVLADRTLLLVEHDIDLVMRISDRITVLNDGGVIATDTPSAIADNDRVREAYLGGYGE